MLLIPLLSLLFVAYCLLVTEEIKVWKRKEEAKRRRQLTWTKLTRKTWQVASRNIEDFLPFCKHLTRTAHILC